MIAEYSVIFVCNDLLILLINNIYKWFIDKSSHDLLLKVNIVAAPKF